MTKLVAIAAFTIASSGLFPVNVKAQLPLTEDASLGAGNSRVIRDVNINGLNSDRIVDGTTRGSNLFHSFQEFNVNTNRGVYFANPPGVENILTRVTGANSSHILGTLGVEGNANLFLINPNGILFGTNAKLDLNGTFIGSTASSIKLGNDGNFSAINPNSSKLLDVKPTALFFNAFARSQITVRGNLEAKIGQTIGLFGGDILIDGGRIEAESGQIFLGAINSGRVNLNLNSNVIDYLRVNSFGDIEITREAGILADTRSSINGKGISIAANNLSIDGRSQISADTFGGGNGGEINILANSLEVSGNGTDIETDVRSGATGKGGTIKIDTNDLNVLNGAEIRAETFGAGDAGSINITANNLVKVSDDSDIEADVGSGGTGNGGIININTPTLQLLNGGEIKAETAAIAAPNLGNGGTININANSIEVGQDSEIEADVGSSTNNRATGKGGTININTNSLKIFNRGEVKARTFGIGDAGDINITARNSVQVDGNGSQIEADVQSGATGRGGTININTNSLQVFNGGEVKAETSAVGNAGDINIIARNLVEVNGNDSQIEADVQSGATGRGGTININTATLKVLNQAEIRAETFGAGDAGNIMLKAQNIEVGRGADIEADVGSSRNSQASGKGGRIDIKTNTLRLFENGDIKAETSAVGNGGDIVIIANEIEITNPDSEITTNVNLQATGDGGDIRIRSNKLSLSDRGAISANTFSFGKAGEIIIESNFLELDRGIISATTSTTEAGGNITLNLDRLLSLRDRSFIGTNAGLLGSGGNGGNIIINSPFIIAFPRDNQIIANAFGGNGGNITISTRAIFGFPQFLTIDASSDLGIDGRIILDTLDTKPDLILRQLQSNPIDAAAIVASDLCQLEGGTIAGGSSFVITGKGGLPPTPSNLTNVYGDLLDWVEIKSRDRTLATKRLEPVVINNDLEASTEKVSFIEAKGWIKRADGKIVLTPNPVSGVLKSFNLVDLSCSP